MDNQSPTSRSLLWRLVKSGQAISSPFPLLPEPKQSDVTRWPIPMGVFDMEVLAEPHEPGIRMLLHQRHIVVMEIAGSEYRRVVP